MKACNQILVTIVAAICLGSLVVADANAGSSPDRLMPRNLRCEYLANPLGIAVAQPRLSWIVESEERGQMQTAYRILVATDSKLLSEDKGDLWDTGKVVSNRSIQVTYDGRPLQSQMRCYWKLRIWDKDDKPSSWTKPASWTMGLLNSEEWKAKWIALDSSRKREAMGEKPDLSGAQWIWSPGVDTRTSAPVGIRYFRKEFTVPEGRAGLGDVRRHRRQQLQDVSERPENPQRQQFQGSHGAQRQRTPAKRQERAGGRGDE